ncbi:30S ribosomal protein S4e [Candidatus Bathyarchaeota archaeon]|nr:MAG: 30S ribosomal protein S4e [Candidatus Bathyarchaeota archaeon]
MGKKGGGKHLKREAAPRFWPIYRKSFHWAVKPSPGPHPIERCIPLLIAVREMLGYAETRREARRIISEGKILVDGRVRRDERFPAGIMDVISIPELKLHYRVLPSRKGLCLHPIDEGEAEFKLCRIEGKSTVKGGHIQLNLHDGRNILIRVEDPRNPEEDVYKTFDTLKIGLKGQEILEHIPLNEGAYVIFTGGKNIGRYGNVVSIDEEAGKKRERALVTIRDPKGEDYQTTLNYAFVVGGEKPLISLPELEGR